MKWLEFSVETVDEAVDAITNILHEAGASGVVIEDAAELSKVRVDQFGEIYALNPDDYPTDGVIVKAYLAESSYVNETIEETTSHYKLSRV